MPTAAASPAFSSQTSIAAASSSWFHSPNIPIFPNYFNNSSNTSQCNSNHIATTPSSCSYWNHTSSTNSTHISFKKVYSVSQIFSLNSHSNHNIHNTIIFISNPWILQHLIFNPFQLHYRPTHSSLHYQDSKAIQFIIQNQALILNLHSLIKI